MERSLFLESHRFCNFMASLSLAFAAVEDMKLIAGVGGKKGDNVAEAFGKSRRCEKGVLALAQIVVVEIDGQSKHVDG